MDAKKIAKSLCIDESYTVRNLKKYRDFRFIIKEEHYVDFIDLFSDFELRGLKSSSLSFVASNMLSPRNHLGRSGKVEKHTETFDICDNDEDSFEEKELKQFSFLDSLESADMLYQIECIKVAIRLIYQTDKSTGDKSASLLQKCLKEIKDPRLTSAFSLIHCVLTNGKPDFFLHLFCESFKQCVYHIIKGKTFDSDSALIIQFYGQLLFYFLWLWNGDLSDYLLLEKETISYLALVIASTMGENGGNDLERLKFAKKSLHVNSLRDRCIAFNDLGLAAVDSGDFQLAYDAFFSWLNQKAIGEIEGIASDIIWRSDENQWRKTKQGNYYCALMHGNLAYVCGNISDTYEFDNKQGAKFYKLSLEHVKKAIDLMPTEKVWYKSYATFLSYDMNYSIGNKKQLYKRIETLELALKLYKDYGSKSRTVEEKLEAGRYYIGIIRSLLFFYVFQTVSDLNVFQSPSDLLDNDRVRFYFSELQRELKNYCAIRIEHESITDSLREEIERRENTKLFLSFVGNNNTAIYDLISIILISIDWNAWLLKDYLHRREYLSTNYCLRLGEDWSRETRKQVAFYTTLKNITHVFEELVFTEQDNAPRPKRDKEECSTKNCLTVMNAKYMNDPNEGIAILKELSKNNSEIKLSSGKGIDGIVKGIFDNYFVFLRSFTEQIDKLTMWNRYASDYDLDGKNSNGCCVLVDPSCFVLDRYYKSEGSAGRKKDDYNLYRVVYISSDGNIMKQRNPGLHTNVYKLYDNLKKLFSLLNDCLKSYASMCPDDIETCRKVIEESLQKSLKRIVFLFKYDDYSDEQESRLILFRDHSNQGDIKLIASDVPLLAVNPFFQIRINGIIFGPNVRNSEKWEPYFQYQLNKMWSKYPTNSMHKNNTDMRKYYIKNSTIKYMT